jgi:hypothetical protein
MAPQDSAKTSRFNNVLAKPVLIGSLQLNL